MSSYNAALGSASSQLVNVGENFCLFRRDNHALALLNQSAARIVLSHVREIDASGCTPEDSAWRIGLGEPTSGNVEHLIAELDSKGFLAPPAHQEASGKIAASARIGKVPYFSTAVSLAGGPVVGVAIQDQALSKLMAAALQPLSAEGAAGFETEISVSRHGEDFAVWRDGKVIASGLDSAAARRICLQAISMALLPAGKVAAILHASSVALDNRAVLLAGSTGSGKTTLMMALVASGANYLADDITPLLQFGNRVAPFPLAASIKQGSWELLSGKFQDLQDATVHQVGERRVRYISPASKNQTGNAALHDVAALIFPTFDPSIGAPKTEAIRPEEALSLLFESGSEVVGSPRSILPLSKLVNEVPAWKLSFPSLGSGVEAVRMITGAS